MRKVKAVLSSLILFLLCKLLLSNDNQDFDVFKVVNPFVFGMMKGMDSILFLIIIGILIPLLMLIILLECIIIDSEEASGSFSDLILHYLIFDMFSVLSIFIMDVIRNRDLKEVGDEKYFKYVLHFVLTPILFVDTIYSIEVEKLRMKKKQVNIKIYTINQLIILGYLLYSFCVILGVNSIDYILKFHMNISHLQIHFRILISEIIWSCFTSLFFGLMANWFLGYL